MEGLQRLQWQLQCCHNRPCRRPQRRRRRLRTKGNKVTLAILQPLKMKFLASPPSLLKLWPALQILYVLCYGESPSPDVLTTAQGVGNEDGNTGPTAGEGNHEHDEEEEEEDDDDGVVITVDRPELEAEHMDEDQHHSQSYEGDYTEQQYGGQMNDQHANNYGQNQQGFGNMHNFNPMMGMQNGMGMGNFGMGMPNMMGKSFYFRHRTWKPRSRLRGGPQGMPGMGVMAGMNLDPSMMFPNGGFGGMGDMNGMMNMGMGGMNGMGGFGGMPDGMGMNMNMNMGGGSGGFFGPGNTGGYNHHQQFGNQLNHTFPHQRGYYGRGRGGFGRGRGGFYPRGGRGGGFNAYNQFAGGPNQSYMQQQPSEEHQMGNDPQQTDYRRGSPTYDPMPTKEGAADDGAVQAHKGEGEDTNGIAAGGTNSTGEQAQDDLGDGAQQGESAPIDGESGTLQGADRLNANAVEGLEAAGNMDVDAAAHDGGLLWKAQSFNQRDFGYGAGRGGFGVQGGAYGNVTTIGGESEPPPAPPVNAPKGPKAMRQGLPNSGRYSRPQQASVPPPAAPARAGTNSLDDGYDRRGRSRTSSRSPSRHESRKDRERTPPTERESEEAYTERKERDRERRKRKEREARDASDKQNANSHLDERGDKTKSRPDSLEDHERRKHRDRHDDRHSSRRDRSRERRKHRDRSRSPGRTHSTWEDTSDRSRRKSKHDRAREDAEDHDRAKDRHGSRKHSRRDDDYEDVAKDRSRHNRSSRDDDRARDRDHGRDREKRQATPESAEDLGFSIKGAAQNKKMGPPTTSRSSRDERRASTRGDSTPATPTQDQYAADREKHMQERLLKHSQSLGKRTSRPEEEGDGSHGEHRASRGKRQRQDTRRHSARFE